jgi:hypothetical protein
LAHAVWAFRLERQRLGKAGNAGQLQRSGIALPGSEGVDGKRGRRPRRPHLSLQFLAGAGAERRLDVGAGDSSQQVVLEPDGVAFGVERRARSHALKCVAQRSPRSDRETGGGRPTFGLD